MQTQARIPTSSRLLDCGLRKLIYSDNENHATNMNKNLCMVRVQVKARCLSRLSSVSRLEPEVPSLETGFDSLLHSPQPRTSSHTLDPHDWRHRSFSRRRFRRNAHVGDTIGLRKARLLPRRERAHQPDLSAGAEPYDLATSYNQHFLPLLEAETEEEASLIKDRLQKWSIERLEAEGLCIRSLRAYWQDATNLGKPVASFSLGVGLLLPHHSFRTGDDVFISRNGPLEQTNKVYRGQVTMVTPTRIYVSFEPEEPLKGEWRLDLGSSDIAFRRMKEAMNSFFFNPQKQLEQELRSHSDIILRGTHLRDVLLPDPSKLRGDPALRANGSLQEDSASNESIPDLSLPLLPKGESQKRAFGGVFTQDHRLASWCKRYSRLDPIVIDGDPDLGSLNNTQLRAIALMLSERISLVQGPPGTGKTRTLIEAIRLLKAHFEVPQPILICTYTNVAVDNLVEGLAIQSTHSPLGHLNRHSPPLNPLRIGLGWDRHHPLYNHNFLAKIERHALKPDLDKLQARIDQLQDLIIAAQQALDNVVKLLTLESRIDLKKIELRDKIKADIRGFQTQRAVKQSIYYGLYRQMTYDVCHDADVICTTCITSASFALTILDFPVVFMDEASMSTEPAALIPLMKGSRHLALIGDHKQLPPVIVSHKAKEGGLAVSLFERLIVEKKTPSIMLDIQYRMHPDISSFPSAEFYDYNLLDGTVDPEGNIAKKLLPPKSKHLEVNQETGRRRSVIFLNHDMQECTRNRSRANEGEAEIVISIIEDLLLNNPDLSGSDIGVISPYIAQTRVIRDLIASYSEVKHRFDSSLGLSRAREIEQIEIKTVDGFEGREKHIIIFSTVRSNERGEIGFLADRRRLNVGLTRAKRALFLVGNAKTLSSTRKSSHSIESNQTDVWKKYLQWLENQNLVIVLRGNEFIQSTAAEMKSRSKRYA